MAEGDKSEPFTQSLSKGSDALANKVCDGCVEDDTYVKDPKHITAEHVQDIYVKLDSDSETCYISGIAELSDDKLIIADKSNEKVKVIDTKRSNVISSLKTPSGPWDIAVLSITSAAVTLPYSRQIMFVKIDEDEIKETSDRIDFPGECRGIAFGDGHLIVTFVDPICSVAIMDTSGQVKRCVEVKYGQWLSHVIHEPSSKTVHVSDVAFGRQGPLIWIESNDTTTVVYESPNLKGPRGLAIGPRGTIFAAGSNNGNILLLTTEGSFINVLIDGLGRPCGICYCPSTHKLYVGFENIEKARDDLRDVLRVYQLS